MDHLELQALASELAFGAIFLLKHSVLLLDNYKR